MMSMVPRFVIALLSVCIAACGSGREADAAGRTQVEAQLRPGRAKNRLPAYPSRPTEYDLRRRRVEPSATARPVSETREEVTATRTPARDLSEELLAAFGNGATCLAPGSVPGGRGTLALSVVVSRSGRVTRANVSAPVSREVQRCLRERAERLSFGGPIDGAPQTVSASIAITSPPPPRDRDLAWKLPAGARTPGVVLPATGNDGLGEGYNPPDRTLPARGPDEMPEGFVPPAETLPAQGPILGTAGNGGY